MKAGGYPNDVPDFKGIYFVTAYSGDMLTRVDVRVTLRAISALRSGRRWQLDCTGIVPLGELRQGGRDEG
jgi:hypothetical protein